jgi:hypothetical protein
VEEGGGRAHLLSSLQKLLVLIRFRFLLSLRLHPFLKQALSIVLI